VDRTYRKRKGEQTLARALAAERLVTAIVMYQLPCAKCEKRKKCLPRLSAEDGIAVYSSIQIRVQGVRHASVAKECVDLWVILRDNVIAASYILLLALAPGNWVKWGDRDRAVNWETTTSPANRGRRCGYATHSSKGHGKREEGLVEHRREECRKGAVILKAEAALRTGEQKGNELPSYKSTAVASRPIVAMPHTLPGTIQNAWNSALVGDSFRLSLPIVDRPRPIAPPC
jgi:hypothetical protein